MVATHHERRELVPTTHEKLGLRLFKLPPAGFEPLQASERELRAHGYPARPDRRRHPRAHAYWQQVLGNPLSMIRPEFAILKGQGSRLRDAAGPPVPGITDSLWSGAIGPGDGNPNQDVRFVMGQWTVPHVLPAGNKSKYGCSTWIGIGGFVAGGGLGGLMSLIQAGTFQEVIQVVDTLHVAVAWWEWLPAPSDGAKAISNFAVSPGDVVACSICLEPDTNASFFMANLTTRVSTAFLKPNPTSQPLANNSAEWIVEDYLDDSSQIPFARYGEVYFDNCLGGTLEDELVPGTGALITLLDQNGTALSTPQLESDSLIKVVYTGP
jgi:hypothetical protein